MNINESKNYCILSNSINKVLLDKFKNYPIISKMNFSDLKSKLEFFSSKRIVFNETFYYLKNTQKKEILDLLNKQNIKYCDHRNVRHYGRVAGVILFWR